MNHARFRMSGLERESLTDGRELFGTDMMPNDFCSFHFNVGEGETHQIRFDIGPRALYGGKVRTFVDGDQIKT